MTVWDMESIYQVPLILKEQGLLDVLSRGLRLDKLELPAPRLHQGEDLWGLWKNTVIPKQHWDTVDIVLVGKYTALDDSYLSVHKALEHAAMRCNRKLRLVSVDSEHLEDAALQKDPTKYHKAWNTICEAKGLVVPGKNHRVQRQSAVYLRES
jgi:CTP synthase